MQTVRRATLVALAVGSLAPASSGIAFAGGHGGAHATGGSGTASNLFQQNTAQARGQNNNCSHSNGTVLTALTGSRLQAVCAARDASVNKHALTKADGAHATGGSGTAVVNQQNTAQEGRQNNTCASLNNTPISLSGGRVEVHCANLDHSRNHRTLTHGGGAHATGGSNTGGVVFQQNTAQEGRQNNTCANPNSNNTHISVSGGRVEAHCANLDHSRNHHTLTRGGGAHATGGSSTAVNVIEQNTAQDGRQNNACNPNVTFITVTGGRVEAHCANLDHSRNHRTLTHGGGAHATGGSSTGGVAQQNTAQEGRQNNACANPNDSSVTVTGGRVEERCANLDHSRNHRTLTHGGGAHATGGSSTTFVDQQSTAQEGRQNNACGNPDNTRIVVSGGRVEERCANLDHSRNHRTLTHGGGAHADGGSGATANFAQQNTAQEGRQNNSCANLNSNNTIISVSGSRVEARCANLDHSRNHRTLTHGGGAHADGGSGTGGDLIQQNIAQEGRQNNACANPNNTTSTLMGSKAEVGCVTIDHSTSVGTAEISHGAEAEGGSGVASLFQQNTAQEGRQNNSCANPNGLTLTASGSRTRTQCLAADASKNIGSVDQ